MAGIEKKSQQFRASSALTNRTYLRQEKQPGRAFHYGMPCRAVFAFSRKGDENTTQNTAWRFTDAEMDLVRNTDLPSLLSSLGYTVKRIGNYYTTAEMDVSASDKI